VSAPGAGLLLGIGGERGEGDATRKAVREALESALRTPVKILGAMPLRGGAVRRHWRVDADVAGARRQFVLRAPGETPLGFGLDLAQEFALLRVLEEAAIAAPRPLALAPDGSFHLTGWLSGSADADALATAPANPVLAESLGRALAALHRIVAPVPPLAFLGRPPTDPAQAALAEFRALLDHIGEVRPVAEWAMRWLARQSPPPATPVLCHGDFRTGNYLVEGGRLVAILDWEFAHWGDPDFDLAWFCARFWRFGAERREAGGIAAHAAFHGAYESAACRRIDPARLAYWETMAALKWLVVALLQRERFLRGGERSLDLALTGRRAAECEYELLRLVEADARSA
jgi:aminoglycoside phosphotransferase (APT) family kinase protein